MRILYDGRAFQFQKAGGINCVFADIISGLPAEYHPLVTGVEDFRGNVPSHPNLEQPRFKHFRPAASASGCVNGGGSSVCSTALICSIPLIMT